ncbi:hypothetical protein [Streptomyces sp. RK76]|uniref:hypothetical protein n=1 Tax=Streptomyces sp. RK76 TaxID=2824896 RepID=UPI001B37064F|nr:hypothetical protein [Streptomyces sp. RK76]MBQ0949212.1 hypothetical protein [Streptomyces sp. RK76]
MARERDGWEWVDGAPRWAPTVSLQIAEILGGLYGHEYDERRAELEDLVRAVYRDAAEKLYGESERSDLDLGQSIGFQKAADLIFPNYPEESDSE